MACLFIGAYACIDETDGAGTNLMDIKQKAWSKFVLEATAPGLEEKLGKLAPAHALAASIASSLWRENDGVEPLIHWTRVRPV